MKRSDAFDKTDNAVLVIDENSVNGKTHKKHVDGSAVCNNKCFIGKDLLASQKSFHARPECISRRGVPGNNRIFAFIEDPHGLKGEGKGGPGIAGGSKIRRPRPASGTFPCLNSCLAKQGHQNISGYSRWPQNLRGSCRFGRSPSAGKQTRQRALIEIPCPVR